MRACTHGATHRSDSVARSTPTAPRSKQERSKNKPIIKKRSMRIHKAFLLRKSKV